MAFFSAHLGGGLGGGQPVEPADHGKRVRAVEAAQLGAQPGPKPLDGRLGRLDQQFPVLR